ncbi:MAG TPA: DUF4258 domain-containing protein [Polyangiaceae bacterium]
MDPTEALGLASGAARYGQLRFTDHAIDQMQERGATVNDVEAAVSSATSAAYDRGQGTWKLAGGVDLDGSPLDVVVAFGGNRVRVITVVEGQTP